MPLVQFARPTRAHLLGAAVATIAGAALVGIAFLPVLAPASVMGEAARRVLHVVCDQIPSRSFFIHGVQLGVCHRCIGIYVGLFGGALLAAGGLRIAPGSRIGWMIAAAPIGVHVALRYIVPATDLADIRVATGLWFGGYTGAAFATALADLWAGRAQPSHDHETSSARSGVPHAGRAAGGERALPSRSAAMNIARGPQT